MIPNIINGISKWLADIKLARKDYRNWKNLTPAKKINCFVSIANCICRMIGVYIFDKCQFNLYSFFGDTMVCIYFTLALYTIVKNTLAENFLEGIKCVSIFGLFLSGLLAHTITAFGSRFKAQECYFTYKKIYNDSDKSIEHNRIREKSIEDSIKQFKTMIGLTFASLVAGVANPVYVYYRDGILHFVTGTDTPFCDKGSSAETYFNIIYTMSLVHMLVGGTVGMQAASTIVCDIINVTTELTLMELNELSEHLEQNQSPRIDVQMRIKRTICQILRSDQFIRDYGDIFYWYFLISPYVLTYSIAISIYSQYILGFPCGYGIAIMSYVQLLIFTTMGQTASDRNNKLCDGLYAFKWYLLPHNPMRYDVCLLLSQVQKGTVFTIGPFEVLNLETAKVLTSRIHSFMMLLLSFK